MKITIRFDGEEFRVPGPDRTEAQAYYTDDRQDAIDTARAIYGQCQFRFVRVACADPDMKYHRRIERAERDNMI